MNRIITVSLAVALAACSYTEYSEQFSTGELSLEVDVVANGNGTSVVWGSLVDSTGGEVELSDEDELIAEVGDDERDLIERGYAQYTAEFPVDYVGTEFRVALLREDERSAKSSFVHLPAPFELTSPRAGDRLRPADETIVITWDRTARDELWVHVEGSCIDGVSTKVTSDTGRYLVHPGEMEVYGDGCDAQIRVERIRRGDIDHRLSGGYIRAKQVRILDVVIRS